MNRRKVVMHTGMSVLLVAAGVEASKAAATATFPTPTPTPTASGSPAVPQTVTATANLNAPRTVGVTFSGSPRIVTAVPVKIGDHVHKGQVLAEVDDREARHELEQAEAGVVAAKGELLDALSSVRSTRAAVAQAQQALCNARLAVHQAKQTLRLDAATQADAVRAAERKLDAARLNVTRTASSSRTAVRATSRVIAPPPPTTPTTTQVRVANRNRNITASTSRAAVADALSEVSAAERTRATTLLADEQQVRTLIGQARLAARDLQAAVAAIPSDPSGERFGPTERARAGLEQARVEVRRAKADLADTQLRAPFEGTVVDIAGAVGESPAAAARGSVATSSNPAGNGVVEDRNAATATGFVVLADLTHRAVTAHVDEEHIGQVKVGQPAVVTFPASGTVVTGTVSSVAVQETVAEHVVFYKVEIDLDDRAATQKLGQTASVVITTNGPQPSALQVPNAAYSRVGDQTIVSVLRQGRLMKMPVTLGVIGARESQISSPLLRPDDLVVVPVTGNRQGRL